MKPKHLKYLKTSFSVCITHTEEQLQGSPWDCSAFTLQGGRETMAPSPPTQVVINKTCEGSNWNIVLFASNKSPMLHYTDWLATVVLATSKTHAICILCTRRDCSVSESLPRCGGERFTLTASISGLQSNFWATARTHCPGGRAEAAQTGLTQGLIPRSSRQLPRVHNLVGVSGSGVSYWTDKKQLFLFEPQYFQASTKQLFRDLTSWDQSRCD